MSRDNEIKLEDENIRKASIDYMGSDIRKNYRLFMLIDIPKNVSVIEIALNEMELLSALKKFPEDEEGEECCDEDI